VPESWFEVAFGPHYPELYGHRDEAEARRCLELLPKLGELSPNGLPVLDLGCGDGRHLSFIGEMNLHVIGLDLSAHLLELASRRQRQVPLLRGDMRHLPFLDQSLDSVFSLFTAFGYFGSLWENENMVQQVSRVLARGGHWFLDYFNCDQVRRELGSGEKFSRQRTGEGMRIHETRRYSQTKGVVSKEVRLEKLPGAGSARTIPSEGLCYTEQVAVFDLEQIDSLAARNGLTRVASAGSYRGDPLENGDRWILVYRKG